MFLVFKFFHIDHEMLKMFLNLLKDSGSGWSRPFIYCCLAVVTGPYCVSYHTLPPRPGDSTTSNYFKHKNISERTNADVKSCSEVLRVEIKY